MQAKKITIIFILCLTKIVIMYIVNMSTIIAKKNTFIRRNLIFKPFIHKRHEILLNIVVTSTLRIKKIRMFIKTIGVICSHILDMRNIVIYYLEKGMFNETYSRGI